jgi:hypothetical protein
MLYWICPECGHECSPAIRECPTCTAPPESTARDSAPPRAEPVQQPAAEPVPQPQTQSVSPSSVVSQELLSLAQNFQSMPPVGLLSPSPTRQLLTAANGYEAAAVAAAVSLQEEPEEQEEPKEPRQSQHLAPLSGLSAKAARPALLKPVELTPSPVPARILSPTVVGATAFSRVKFSLKPAGPVPTGEVTFQAASGHPIQHLPAVR